MNRRQLLTAIPAAVAALTASKSLAGARTPVDASAAIVGQPEGIGLVPRGRNGERMEPDFWYCDRCDADTLPTGPRINDGHAIVRRGYADMGKVWLDGQPVGDFTVEALEGECGWVVFEVDRRDFSGRPLPQRYDLMCPNCYGEMLEVKYGDVQLHRTNGITEFDGKAYRQELTPPVLALDFIPIRYDLPSMTYVAPRGEGE